jgi:hypothetical protein
MSTQNNILEYRESSPFYIQLKSMTKNLVSGVIRKRCFMQKQSLQVCYKDTVDKENSTDTSYNILQLHILPKIPG